MFTEFKLNIVRAFAVAELEPVVGGKNSLWEAIEAREFGYSGTARSVVFVATRKIKPKPKYDILVIQLANPGATGLAPELEAAFVDSFAARQAKRFKSIVRAPTAPPPTGSALELTFRLHRVGGLGVAYQSVDRASGEVRHKGFGRVHIGKDEQKDVRNAATLCALPE